MIKYVQYMNGFVQVEKDNMKCLICNSKIIKDIYHGKIRDGKFGNYLENQTIYVNYLFLDVEGYEESYSVELPSTEIIEAGGAKEINIPIHFNYVKDIARKIRVRIKNTDGRILTAKDVLFDPKIATTIKEIKFEPIP